MAYRLYLSVLVGGNDAYYVRNESIYFNFYFIICAVTSELFFLKDAFFLKSHISLTFKDSQS